MDAENQVQANPEAVQAFRLGQLLLILGTLSESGQPSTVDRIAYNEFLAANPFLVVGQGESDHLSLTLAGFAPKALSYMSSRHRFTSRRERLQNDLARLVSLDLATYTATAGNVEYAPTAAGRELAAQLQSGYAQAVRFSAALIGRRLRRLSNKQLRTQAEAWLGSPPLLIDLYE